MKRILMILVLLTLLGLSDSVYLYIKHLDLSSNLYLCPSDVYVDCGGVLASKYSEVFGIPLGLLGIVNYGYLLSVVIGFILFKKRIFKYLLLIQVKISFLVSLILMYLQIFVLKSICLYCSGSALISLLIFVLVFTGFRSERKRLSVEITYFVYKYLIRPLLFLTDSEKIHDFIINLGNKLGEVNLVKSVIRMFLVDKNKNLKQNISGIDFENPLGLAAGFDYDANLTDFIPLLGFGFTTVGTVTNSPYEGNPKPRLGRLVKSKSLLVNKGFKSIGSKAVTHKLKGKTFDIPVGVSIGRTNSPQLLTYKQSIKDIVETFNKFEKEGINNMFFELNISCPNLIHSAVVEFYQPRQLNDLLVAIDKLQLNKPVFVKMPINKSDQQILSMLRVIARHKITGVIFGNLQKDKNDPALHSAETERFKSGYFSGKPTYKRSNQLISLCYKHFKDRFVIIGCGGVFSADEAYEKIKRGASLVQLLTGLIYQGPQLVQKINFELVDLLEKDGYKNISDAVGSKTG